MPASRYPADRQTIPRNSATMIPYRSVMRPIMMLPRPKPTIVSVYGRDASPRATPNSAWIEGTTTATTNMPQPPMVIRATEASSLSQAAEESATAAVGVMEGPGRYLTPGPGRGAPRRCRRRLARAGGSGTRGASRLLGFRRLRRVREEAVGA